MNLFLFVSVYVSKNFYDKHSVGECFVIALL